MKVRSWGKKRLATLKFKSDTSFSGRIMNSKEGVFSTTSSTEFFKVRGDFSAVTTSSFYECSCLRMVAQFLNLQYLRQEHKILSLSINYELMSSQEFLAISLLYEATSSNLKIFNRFRSYYWHMKREALVCTIQLCIINNGHCLPLTCLNPLQIMPSSLYACYERVYRTEEIL